MLAVLTKMQHSGGHIQSSPSMPFHTDPETLGRTLDDSPMEGKESEAGNCMSFRVFWHWLHLVYEQLTSVPLLDKIPVQCLPWKVSHSWKAAQSPLQGSFFLSLRFLLKWYLKSSTLNSFCKIATQFTYLEYFDLVLWIPLVLNLFMRAF